MNKQSAYLWNQVMRFFTAACIITTAERSRIPIAGLLTYFFTGLSAMVRTQIQHLMETFHPIESIFELNRLAAN